MRSHSNEAYDALTKKVAELEHKARCSEEIFENTIIAHEMEGNKQITTLKAGNEKLRSALDIEKAWSGKCKKEKEELEKALEGMTRLYASAHEEKKGLETDYAGAIERQSEWTRLQLIREENAVNKAIAAIEGKVEKLSTFNMSGRAHQTIHRRGRWIKRFEVLAIIQKFKEGK
jgi:hypothetical protein